MLARAKAQQPACLGIQQSHLSLVPLRKPIFFWKDNCKMPLLGSVVKNLPASARDTEDMSLSPGSGRSPGGGNGNLLHYFLPGESHGQRSLVGCSPRGHKKQHTTEHARMLLLLPFLKVKQNA